MFHPNLITAERETEKAQAVSKYENSLNWMRCTKEDDMGKRLEDNIREAQAGHLKRLSLKNASTRKNP